MFKIVSAFLICVLSFQRVPISHSRQSDLLAPSSACLELADKTDLKGRNITKGIVASVAVAFIVGMQPYFLKKAFEENPSIFSVLACYSLINLCLSAPVAARDDWRNIRSAVSWRIVASGILATSILAIPLKYAAIFASDAITPDAIIRMAPLMVLFISVLSKQERLTLRKLIGVLFVIFSVAGVIFMTKSGVMGQTTFLGVAFAFISMLGYATADVLEKKIFSQKMVGKWTYLFLGSIAGFLVFSAMSVLSGASITPIFSFYILMLSLNSVAGLIGKYYSFQYLEATLVRCIIACSSLATLFWLAVLNWQIPEPFFLLLGVVAVSILGLTQVLYQHQIDSKEDRAQSSSIPISIVAGIQSAV